MNDRAAGERLERHLRQRLPNLTWDEIAERADIGRDTLYRWRVKGVLPSARPGTRLAKLMDETYQDLLDVRAGRDPRPYGPYSADELYELMKRVGNEIADQLEERRRKELLDDPESQAERRLG